VPKFYQLILLIVSMRSIAVDQPQASLSDTIRHGNLPEDQEGTAEDSRLPLANEGPNAEQGKELASSPHPT